MWPDNNTKFIVIPISTLNNFYFMLVDRELGVLKAKVQVYGLTYHQTLHFTFWSLDELIRVPL